MSTADGVLLDELTVAKLRKENARLLKRNKKLKSELDQLHERLADYRERLAVTENFAPELYRCADCGSVVATGYCCGACGSADPKNLTTKKEH